MTKDTWIRTLKTFIQVFFGTLIPALITAATTPPEAWSEVLAWLGGIFTPQLIVGDCLSAAICAAWNGIANVTTYSVGEEAATEGGG